MRSSVEIQSVIVNNSHGLPPPVLATSARSKNAKSSKYTNKDNNDIHQGMIWIKTIIRIFTITLMLSNKIQRSSDSYWGKISHPSSVLSASIILSIAGDGDISQHVCPTNSKGLKY